MNYCIGHNFLQLNHSHAFGIWGPCLGPFFKRTKWVLVLGWLKEKLQMSLSHIRSSWQIRYTYKFKISINSRIGMINFSIHLIFVSWHIKRVSLDLDGLERPFLANFVWHLKRNQNACNSWRWPCQTISTKPTTWISYQQTIKPYDVSIGLHWGT